MDLKTESDAIRNKALALGFDAVGIAAASTIDPKEFREWLENGFQGQMGYLERGFEKRVDPELVLEGAKSIVSLALNYLHPYPLPYEDLTKGSISRYAAGGDYHEILLAKIEQLLVFIQELLPESRAKTYVDTGPVMEKYWASRAGIGWLGKHTNVLSRKLGSWFFLGEILLDATLAYDEPALDFCGSCTRCLDACPTNAFPSPYVLDSRRCISYLTIEFQDDIPLELRTPMKNLIFGCDICQDVCPWNDRSPESKFPDLEPRNENKAAALTELANLDPHEFALRFRKSPVKRAKWRGLMRNVAVAMGNSLDPRMIRPLLKLLSSEDAMVRRHAAWAIAKIGSDGALAAIESQLAVEKDSATKQELERLLIDGSPRNST